MCNFSLAENLTSFQTSDRRSFEAVENPANELNLVTDRLAVSPEQIDMESETLETLMDLCHGFVHLPINLQTQLCYLVSSSMGNLAQEIGTYINSGDMVDLLSQWKRHLEEYGYLSHVILTFLQDDIHIASSQSSTLGRGGSKKSQVNSNNKTTAGSAAQLFQRTVAQIESICEAIVKVLEINLSKFFQTTPEKDLFVGLFTRPLNGLLEFEATIKVPSLKFFIQKIIAISVKSQNQGSNAQNAIMTNLTYFLHLSTFNAELLKLINDEYDYSQLTEEVLSEISSRVFNAKDTNGPKVISNFLVKLSQMSPQIMLRQMSLVVRLLNNSSIALRCSVVEACGNIITGLALDEEASEHYKQQLGVLLELLEERFRDSNPYVRTKAIQGCLKICDLNSKFNKNRVTFTKLAVRSLQDRSSLVRRNAVKLLSKLLSTHPFRAIHGDQLRLEDWVSNLNIASNSLKQFIAENSLKTSLDDIMKDSEPLVACQEDGNITNADESSLVSRNGEEANDTSRIDTEPEAMDVVEAETILKMKLMIVYHKDAINFIEEIQMGLLLGANLLSSRNRNEVLETMDFFVMADAYGLEPSRLGVRKMLHLVWMKGANDEGTSIASHLISCYTQLFLNAPDNFNFKERAALISKNLINLTIGASAADLASLEQLLGMMYNEKLIDDNIINVLWAIYTSASSETNGSEVFNKEQIHGSVIVLGMLSAANHEISLRGFESLLDVGLGKAGAEDLNLCRYSCLMLQRMIPRKSSSRVVSIIGESREQLVVKNLYSKIITYTEDAQWYPMCEQALNALFTISSKPDIVAGDLVREKTMITFGKPEDDDSKSLQPSSRVTSLSHLLFIAGQVAIKILEYLEKCETEFKTRKLEAETNKGKEKDNTEENDAGDSKRNELEMIGGTNEDDFADAINHVKENELLFGESSILGKLSPIVEEIVSNSTRFDDVMLQRTAALCLEKFMCVSSKYCEKSLSLLITVMEKSQDPIVRSNAVLGLGDMAVCFNNLIDENTYYLYRRLHDESLMVQRTCLMTVTFLILAGQVKVKGQLSQMAKCLENADNGISDMCRLFFTELAGKDNAIYNGFIDIFSNLSSDQNLNKESFRKIIKFLLSFIEKERHQKQLTDKLLGRLTKCESQTQWDDIAFVLNNIPNKNDKVSAILEEGFKMVSAKD